MKISEKTDAEWQAELPQDKYDVLRRKGTEPPFSGEFVHTKEDGTYVCGACGAALFSSQTKFDSGTGWRRSKRTTSSSIPTTASS